VAVDEGGERVVVDVDLAVADVEDLPGQAGGASLLVEEEQDA
jgi:hypothetical protein